MKQITEEITPTSGKVTLETANSLWQLPIFPIYDSYKSQLQSYLNAEARVLDFTQPNAVDIINGWIEDKTHDKVQDMLDGIPPGVVMYLINAVYFKGDWKYTFEEKNTKPGTFYINNETYVPVSLMHQITYLKYYENKTFSMVSLPYADSAYRMLVLLPSQQNTLNDVIDGLTPSTLSNWQNEAKYEKVNIYLPKFKFADGTRLINEELKSLGLTDAFDERANFSKITSDPIMISRVLHKSFIEVNEKGSEAAAATIVETWITSVIADQYDFYANRPFIFAIYHEPSNTILFIGKLANPSVE
jgi:serpin B